MTAAFVLAINLFIAAIFSVAFGVVALTNRTARGAGWVSAGYGLGIVDVTLEFALHWHGHPTPYAISIFLVFLAATTFCLVGVAGHYRVAPPWAAMIAIWIISLVSIPAIFTLPYGSVPRALLYQFPYVAIQSLIGWTIFRSQRRQPLDLVLIVLSTFAALTYLFKPAIAWSVGSAGTPQGYMATTYAAISQSTGAVTLIALALVLLMVMMRDATAEMAAQSEIDPLSGVLNRRGFDAKGEQMVAHARRTGEQLTLITADLDRFKAINDRFGHAAGDEVIVRFAAKLSAMAPEDAVVARLGGEEFAVLLHTADLAAGRRYAEGMREALSNEALLRQYADQPVTASFGVAQMAPDDTLFDLSRRSDAALYKAKTGGRNRVHLALKEMQSSKAPASPPQRGQQPDPPAHVPKQQRASASRHPEALTQSL